MISTNIWSLLAAPEIAAGEPHGGGGPDPHLGRLAGSMWRFDDLVGPEGYAALC